jgi:hypothetical protein
MVKPSVGDQAVDPTDPPGAVLDRAAKKKAASLAAHKGPNGTRKPEKSSKKTSNTETLHTLLERSKGATLDELMKSDGLAGALC